MAIARACLFVIAIILPELSGDPPAGQGPAPLPDPPRVPAKLVGEYRSVMDRLIITAGGRFNHELLGDKGTFLFRSEGRAEYADGYLVLWPDDENDTPLHSSLLPVRWGERLYLIPEEEGDGFCNFINFGIEPTDREVGLFYLRDGDWTKPATGQPDIPRSWRAKLLAKPIAGSVTEVLPGRKARVNLGKKDGVWVGMELQMSGKGTASIRVATVEHDSCIIEVAEENLPSDANVAFEKSQTVASSSRRLLEEKFKLRPGLFLNPKKP